MNVLKLLPLNVKIQIKKMLSTLPNLNDIQIQFCSNNVVEQF